MDTIQEAIRALSRAVNEEGLITDAEDRQEIYVTIGLLTEYEDE